jgi:acetyltransferase-like isoleucine patch superfamily enzyme
MVGTGAVVTKDVEPKHIVLGIPAKTARVKTPQND